jgi:nitric oxide reductase NorE protein
MTAMQSRMEPEHPAAGRTEAAAAVEPRSRVNPMMWLLIASELAVFGAALLGYAFARAKDPSGFLAAQNELDRFAGAVNTVALLTSGLLAALAVEARAAGLRSRARQLLAGAGALGVVFLAVKAQEYAVEIGNGHGLDDGGFVTLYFLITGFHAAHVVLGLVILGIVAWWDDLDNIETGAAFWHMVDLVWVIVFPCLYLMR